MTEGLVAISDGHFDAARAAFRMAKELKPQSPEPADGLLQVDQAVRMNRIQVLERRALAEEGNEEWESVVSTFEDILEIDDTLEFAQQGLARARQMAALHEQLDEYIENPDSLSAPATMQKATMMVVDITRMHSVGPRLSNQRDELSRLLKRAATPLTVQLVSDNATDVSIYKIGKLGSFATHELNLRPGKYVAVGSRPGYRDVRLEFPGRPGTRSKTDNYSLRGTDLNFDHLIVKDVEGERRFDNASLPLRVGTGSDCNLRLPGPGGGPVVLLDLLDGAPFVQPVGRDASMQINGEPLRTSRRLEHADELEFFGSRIVVAASDDGLVLEVYLEDSAYVTQPPVAPDDATSPAEETIAPTAFQRASKTQAQVHESQHSSLKMIVGAVLAVLLIASYLLFSAISVQFDVEPANPDSISIAGGWFRLPLGDRVLLRSGQYTVNVRKEGYYDVSQAFSVGDEPSLRVPLKMRRLPGRLVVTTEPFVDAVVSIDNGMLGKAPYGPIELQPGEHSVGVKAKRYLPFADVVNISGLGREETLAVQLVPRWSDVSIKSEPSGAAIFVADEQVGETPATIELLEGTHQISVVRDGFSAWDGNGSRETKCGAITGADSAAAGGCEIAGQFNSARCECHCGWSLPWPVAAQPLVVARCRLCHRPVESRLWRHQSSRATGCGRKRFDHRRPFGTHRQRDHQCVAWRCRRLCRRAGARYRHGDPESQLGAAPHRGPQAGLRELVALSNAAPGLSANADRATALS